jgi:ABC-type Fe3+/spermidine/putrescine transport system ATPase subunit
VDGRIVGREGDEGIVEVVGGARWRVRLHGDGADAVRVMVRPEALRLVPANAEDTDGAEGVAGRVTERRFAGAVTVYRVEIRGGPELLVTVPGQGPRHEAEVRVIAQQGPPLHAFPRGAE